MGLYDEYGDYDFDDDARLDMAKTFGTAEMDAIGDATSAEEAMAASKQLWDRWMAVCQSHGIDDPDARKALVVSGFELKAEMAKRTSIRQIAQTVEEM